MLVDVQASVVDHVARVRRVRQDPVRFVVRSPACRLVTCTKHGFNKVGLLAKAFHFAKRLTLELVEAHRALVGLVATRPRAQSKGGAYVRGGKFTLASGVPRGRALL